MATFSLAPLDSATGFYSADREHVLIALSPWNGDSLDGFVPGYESAHTLTAAGWDPARAVRRARRASTQLRNPARRTLAALGYHPDRHVHSWTQLHNRFSYLAGLREARRAYADDPVVRRACRGTTRVAVVWMLTRGDDIAKVFADSRLSRNLQALAPRMAGVDSTTFERGIFSLDPPDHTRRAAARHVPVIEDIADPPLESYAWPCGTHSSTRRLLSCSSNRAPNRSPSRSLISIAARIYHGSNEDAFGLGVRMNIEYGLALGRVDRAAAAARIIGSHPEWSDRMIAPATGISAGSVAKVRQRSSAHEGQPTTRVGKDGRERPLSRAEEIAAGAGISASTVHDVRKRLRTGQDPVPPDQRTGTLVQPSQTCDRQLGEPGPVPRCLDRSRIAPAEFNATTETTLGKLPK